MWAEPQTRYEFKDAPYFYFYLDVVLGEGELRDREGREGQVQSYSWSGGWDKKSY